MSSQPLQLNTLDAAEVAGKTVLVRVDLNVPVIQGRVSDMSRICAILPTLRELVEKKAKVVVLSHFDRPEGRFVPSLSLAPLVDVLEKELGQPVHFAVDCIGQPAIKAAGRLGPGEVLMLENVRFHPGEEAGDESFSRQLAQLGELYVNDAFSAAHRDHASITGIPKFLPAYAGRLLQREVEAFSQLLEHPKRPLAAVVGGAKISTKLEILDHLLGKVDYLIVGGAMANSFLAAQGLKIGRSLYEADRVDTAKQIIDHAGKTGCQLVLPTDFVVARRFETSPPCEIVSANEMPDDAMQLDIGPESVLQLSELLKSCRSVVWNGPLGAFETRPFDVSTIQLARLVAGRTQSGELFSMAGGGDTVSALSHAGLAGQFSYLSTAGGAFLEWLQGKTLPGISALQKAA